MTNPGEALLLGVLKETTKALLAGVKMLWTSKATRWSAADRAAAADIAHAGKVRRRRIDQEEKRQEELKDLEHRRNILVALQKEDDPRGLLASDDPVRDALRVVWDETAAINAAANEEHQAELSTPGTSIESQKAHARQRLRARGVHRTTAQIEYEQANIEEIIVGAGQTLEDDADGPSRVPEEDWLMRFFNYAAEVSEEQVMNVLKRALADAAKADRPLTSPRTLDTLRFFQPYTYDMFDYLASQLVLFGGVPATYFDRDPRAKENGLDLPLMMEMGLCKVDRVKAFRFCIGLATFSFSFKPAERFEFDLIRLTQVGKEISGLIDADARILHGVGAGAFTDQRIWTLQRKFGLSGKEAKYLALSLISDICDKFGLRIEIYRAAEGGGNQSIHESHRDSVEQPFNIDVADHCSDLDEENRDLIGVFLDEFKQFDEYELPILLDQRA